MKQLRAWRIIYLLRLLATTLKVALDVSVHFILAANVAVVLLKLFYVNEAVLMHFTIEQRISRYVSRKR